MTLLHIEGFDVINSTTKSALVGIDMSHQAAYAGHAYNISPGTLTEFDVAGRYAGSSGIKLNHEQHKTSVSYEDGTNYYLGNTGTWSRIPFPEQQALGSFTFGFAFKTFDAKTRTVTIKVIFLIFTPSLKQTNVWKIW